MKRYFIIFLTLIVVIASFPVVAYADNFDPVTNPLGDLFELADTSERTFNYNGNSLTVSLDVGEDNFYIAYTEFLVYSGNEITSVVVNNRNAVLERMGSTYRFYTTSGFRPYGSVDITFNFASSDSSFVVLHSAQYSSVITDSYVLDTTIEGTNPQTFSVDYTGSYVDIPAYFVMRNVDQDFNFRVDFYMRNVSRFDFINLIFVGYWNEFTSISAGFEDRYNLPVSVSYLNGISDEFYNKARISIDLRDVNWSLTSDTLSLFLYGNYHKDIDVSPTVEGDGTLILTGNDPEILMTIYGIYGFFIFDEINPVIFWFRKTYHSLGSWFNNLFDQLQDIFTGRAQDLNNADSFNDSVDDQSDELEDLTSDLNSVTRPPISDVNLSTGTMVNQSTIVLATSGIGSIMSNTIILRVLTMALTFALAGFILFGKR